MKGDRPAWSRLPRAHAAAVRLPSLLGAALLGACASVPTPPPAPTDWQARRDAVSAIERFALDGRVAARGPVAGSAKLDWTQDGERYSLRLAGPFGAGAVLIDGAPDMAVLRHQDETLRTADPEATLRARLGWTLPVTSLRWWILGLPAPDAPAQTGFDAAARLETLVQHGWTVKYREYRAADAVSPIFDLPRRLELSQGELSLRVLIDRWNALEP